MIEVVANEEIYQVASDFESDIIRHSEEMIQDILSCFVYMLENDHTIREKDNFSTIYRNTFAYEDKEYASLNIMIIVDSEYRVILGGTILLM